MSDALLDEAVTFNGTIFHIQVDVPGIIVGAISDGGVAVTGFSEIKRGNRIGRLMTGHGVDDAPLPEVPSGDVITAERPFILQKAGALQGQMSYVAFAPNHGTAVFVTIWPNLAGSDVRPDSAGWFKSRSHHPSGHRPSRRAFSCAG